MVVSRRDPLWRTSVLVTLFRRLEGWSPGENVAAGESRGTDTELDKVTEKVRVRLGPRFCRVGESTTSESRVEAESEEDEKL